MPLKPGPKSSFDNLKVDQVKLLISKGFKDREIAEFLGVTPVTYCNWKTKHKEFFNEIKEWKKAVTIDVEKSLLERAKGYTHEAVKFFVVGGKIVQEKYLEHYPPDTRACEVWLYNNSEEWADRKEVKNTVEITFSASDLEQARNRAFASN